MESVLKSMIGRQVAVWSVAGSAEHRDDGMLQGYDDLFVWVRDDKGQDLYFSIPSIRLIKPLR